MDINEYKRDEAAWTADSGTTSPFERHVAATCKAAGLNVMIDILHILFDRERLDVEVIIAMDASDVQTLYFDYIYPAIDRAEEALLDLPDDVGH